MTRRRDSGRIGFYAAVGLRRLPDGAWRAAGPEAEIGFGPAPSVARLAGARVRLRSDLRGLDGARVSPVLVLRTPGGERRVRLSATAEGTDDLIRVPPDLLALRLLPLDGPGRFHLTRLDLDRSGPLGGALAMARRLLMRLPPEERRPARLVRRAVGLIRTTPPREIWRRLARGAAPPRPAASYADWIAAVEAPALPSPEAMRARIAGLRERPRISVLMDVDGARAERVVAALASLRAQAYPDWELCPYGAADALAGLAALAHGDARIRLPPPGSATGNDALSRASGSHVLLMEPDALLPPHALFALACALDADPTLDMVYADEDAIDADGTRARPHFKPDWSPETLEGSHYTGRPALLRLSLVRELGGLRPDFEGAQDYDLALRATEGADRRILHLDQVLYHRRADAPAPDEAAALHALEDRGRRTGGCESVQPVGHAGGFALRRSLTHRPLVSIVIPSAGRDSVIRGAPVDLLAACLGSIRATSTYEAVEIVVVDNGDLRESTRAAVERHGARRVTYAEPRFNVAAKMNLGARHARGDVLVFLNDDIEVITPDWIEAMLSRLHVEGVGVVGPKLLFENGDLQHVGVVFGEGLPDHVRRGFPGDDAGYHLSSVTDRTCLAVTGACMMLARAEFEAVGGFDEGYAINYNDIDLCLRIGERGLRTVYCAQGVLTHFESRNRVATVDPAEQARFRRRWGARLTRDPYYPRWFGIRPPAFDLDADRFSGQ